jgi:hypothetical protein
MAIKPSWIVCSMDNNALCTEHGKVQEFGSEKAAIRRAGEWVKTSEDQEAWVYCLSHVVSRPDAFDVEAVKKTSRK